MPKILPVSFNNSVKSIKKNINKNTQKNYNVDLAYEDKGFYKIGDKFVKQVFTR